METGTDSYAQGMSEFKAEDYELTSRLTKFEYGLFRNFLGAKLLEVGAGWGRMTALVLKETKPAEIIAIEPSPQLFLRLQRYLSRQQGLTTLNCEVGQLKETHQNYFDSIFSVHVLEHIEDDRRFVEDSLALLKSNGRLIILVPALQFLFSELDRNIGHYRRYDKPMVRSLLQGLDVKIEKMFYSNFVGVLASLYFLKFKKLEYQSSDKKGKFLFLLKIYDRFVVPLVAFIESRMPVPIGLNLTVVIQKR